MYHISLPHVGFDGTFIYEMKTRTQIVEDMLSILHLVHTVSGKALRIRPHAPPPPTGDLGRGNTEHPRRLLAIIIVLDIASAGPLLVASVLHAAVCITV